MFITCPLTEYIFLIKQIPLDSMRTNRICFKALPIKTIRLLHIILHLHCTFKFLSLGKKKVHLLNDSNEERRSSGYGMAEKEIHRPSIRPLPVAIKPLRNAV